LRQADLNRFDMSGFGATAISRGLIKAARLFLILEQCASEMPVKSLFDSSDRCARRYA
jgi:hypothetical protein